MTHGTRVLGSTQTSRGAEPPPSSSAPTGDGGCCTSRCGMGWVKGSGRAALIVHGACSMAAWTASLFGREKARTGSVSVSRSHTRLETGPRAQTVNARGRREGKGGWGCLGTDSKRARGGGEGEGCHRQTDRYAGPYPYQLCKGTEFSLLYFLHQQHPNFSLHCYPSSAGGEVVF